MSEIRDVYSRNHQQDRKRPGYATIGFGSCRGRVEPADIVGVAKKPFDADAMALEPRRLKWKAELRLFTRILLCRRLDPDEVLHGQLLTVLTALLRLLVLHLLAALALATL